MRLTSLFALSLFALVALARGDDGIMYSFGAPRLMHGESTLRLVREFVSADVYRDHAIVHCRFVVRNGGQAVNARIGFPDGSDQSGYADEPITPCLTHFRSRVDGKRVATRIEISAIPFKDAPLYHVKTVHFAAHQTRIIEDWYDGDLSGGATNSDLHAKQREPENLYVSQFEYIMESGGSWKGTILQATLEVRFISKQMRRLRPFPESQIGEPVYESTILGRLPKNAVIWRGFARPRVSGNRMVFERKNFKPTKKDNIFLTFDAETFNNSIWNH